VAEPGDVNPWYQDFVAALGDGFEVPVWAPEQPFAAQGQDAIAVANVGPAGWRASGSGHGWTVGA
jgi:hypothetical protein